MTARPVPRRHWRSYGDDTLPTGAEALDEPFAAFPSWFMGITSDRRGQEMVYRGGCVAEYLERSPSTYDEQIGVA